MKCKIRSSAISAFAAFSLLLFLGSFSVDRRERTMNARDLTEQMLRSIEGIKTLRFSQKLSERIGTKIMHTESDVKYQKSPRKLYLYLKGAELLWVEGQNNGDALVNPGSFPYVNLNLDPNGNILRKDQHHTINEIGFDYFAGIVRHEIKRAGTHFDRHFMYAGEEKWESRACYKLLISNPDFSSTTYVVKKGESLISIARQLKVSEYMILEMNPKLENYHHVRSGEKINVPTAYARSTIVLIDKEMMLPLSIKVIDDKGLFEHYEYHRLLLNSRIGEEEFRKDYKDYHF